MGECDYPIDPVNPACDACLVGFEFFKNIWDFGPTEEVIEKLLDEICLMFPENTPFRTECQEFINKEFENLINWVDQDFPPKYICTMLNACDFPVDPIDGVCEVCKAGF